MIEVEVSVPGGSYPVVIQPGLLQQGGDRIEIRGFGSFSVRNRRSRQGRNPKTGETISVPAKRVPFFTVGHELKKRINASAGYDGDETVEVELKTAAE